MVALGCHSFLFSAIDVWDLNTWWSPVVIVSGWGDTCCFVLRFRCKWPPKNLHRFRERSADNFARAKGWCQDLRSTWCRSFIEMTWQFPRCLPENPVGIHAIWILSLWHRTLWQNNEPCAYIAWTFRWGLHHVSRNLLDFSWVISNFLLPSTHHVTVIPK